LYLLHLKCATSVPNKNKVVITLIVCSVVQQFLNI